MTGKRADAELPCAVYAVDPRRHCGPPNLCGVFFFKFFPQLCPDRLLHRSANYVTTTRPHLYCPNLSISLDCRYLLPKPSVNFT